MKYHSYFYFFQPLKNVKPFLAHSPYNDKWQSKVASDHSLLTLGIGKRTLGFRSPEFGKLLLYLYNVKQWAKQMSSNTTLRSLID